MSKIEIVSPRFETYTNRRGFLSGIATGVFMCAGGASFADELIRTPAQTEGPFYPDKLPLDTDNDLVEINDSLTSAVGEIVYLSGRVLDAKGNPLRNAIIEIWQVDSKGVYLHKDGGDRNKMDAHFQGFGRFSTGSKGEYLFRTIKPVPYPGRAPHIHVAVKKKGMEKFVTQCYIKGDPRNEKDGVVKGITDMKQRASVMVPFTPLKDSRIGELEARFDIVLGYTPSA
jgi:protocatechuate 3,4-dioxygenase beta subunit